MANCGLQEQRPTILQTNASFDYEESLLVLIEIPRLSEDRHKNLPKTMPIKREDREKDCRGRAAQNMHILDQEKCVLKGLEQDLKDLKNQDLIHY